jgi:hypothetical protein
LTRNFVPDGNYWQWTIGGRNGDALALSAPKLPKAVKPDLGARPHRTSTEPGRFAKRTSDEIRAGHHSPNS